MADSHDDARNEGSLSEALAAQVLKRATELEARGVGQIEVAELRRVALDAGIPLDAFERALAETRSRPSTEVVAPRRPGTASESTREPAGKWGWLRRATIGFIGFGLAAGSAFLTEAFDVNSGAAVVFSIILIGLAAFRLAWARRDRGEVSEFLFDLTPLWLGFTLAWMLIDPRDADSILSGSSLVGIIAAVVGAGVVKARPGGIEFQPTMPSDPQRLIEKR